MMRQNFNAWICFFSKLVTMLYLQIIYRGTERSEAILESRTLPWSGKNGFLRMAKPSRRVWQLSRSVAAQNNVPLILLNHSKHLNSYFLFFILQNKNRAYLKALSCNLPFEFYHFLSDIGYHQYISLIILPKVAPFFIWGTSVSLSSPLKIWKHCLQLSTVLSSQAPFTMVIISK